MNLLLILNDPTSGTEPSYNGLRLTGTSARRDDVTAHTVVVLGGGAARDPPR